MQNRFFTLGLIFCATALFSLSAQGKSQRELLIDIKKAPSVSDWRYFQNMDSQDRERFWSYHEARGKKLKDWIWGWRLGWIRTCTFAREAYCLGILRQAIHDRAAVVRAEAATRLGERYEGTKNQLMIDLLAAAYKNPYNVRRGKPLFVQQRILFAIKQIGGNKAEETGKKLALTHKSSALYWEKISAVK